MPKKIESINPATEELLQSFEPHGAEEVERALAAAATAFVDWRRRSFEERGRLARAAAAALRRDKARLAGLVTAEMGKPIVEAEGEVEKCAWGFEYYAEN